jgi:hypothetical protein
LLRPILFLVIPFLLVIIAIAEYLHTFIIVVFITNVICLVAVIIVVVILHHHVFLYRTLKPVLSGLLPRIF